MSRSTAANTSLPEPGSATTTDAVRPFRVGFAESDVAELRRRLLATRWPERETVDDASSGVQLTTIHRLADYWGTEYDLGRVEARLNAVPHFLTGIDGLDIHFIHVRSPHPDALPLIITHGWPGSVVEMLEVIGPLTDPPAYGGDELRAAFRSLRDRSTA